MHLIEVAPFSDGWRVHVDRVAHDMVFRSGGRAEAAARRLAERLGRAGQMSELRIRLRDDSLAASQVWPAASRSPAVEALEAAA